MHCSHCGTPAAPDHRFCAQCGSPLQQEARADSNFTLFPDEAPADNRADKGFLLLAALFLGVALLWFTWTRFGNSSGDGSGYKIIAAITSVINFAEVGIMVVFTRRPRYRSAIFAMGILFLLLELVLYVPLWTTNS